MCTVKVKRSPSRVRASDGEKLLFIFSLKTAASNGHAKMVLGGVNNPTNIVASALRTRTQKRLKQLTKKCYLHLYHTPPHHASPLRKMEKRRGKIF